MSDKPIVQVDGMGHSYGETRVLGGVSFALRHGELLAVLGASGSGKSTLLRAIAGFVCATEGQIQLDGRVVSDVGREHVPAEKRGVGLVFQDYALFPHMTVAENVAYGIVGQADKESRVRELLELVNLPGYEKRRPNSLSGGQKQRVALARALAPRPSVLLLDEPFANLDGPIRRDVGQAVRELLRKTGAAGVLVTHDRAEAMALADRVAVLGGTSTESGGEAARLLQIGTPEQLYVKPNSAEVASLTGFVLSVQGEANGAVATTTLGELALQESYSGSVELLIRRHQISFEAGTGDDTVCDCQFVGPGYRLLVRSTLGQVWTDHPVRADVGTYGHLRVSGACMATPSQA